MSFPAIKEAVSKWSRENFGSQGTGILTVNGDCTGDIEVELEHLAPLYGIVEELGELADEDASTLDKVDACADITIYTMDFLSRQGEAWCGYSTVSKVVAYNSTLDEQEYIALMTARVGKLCHLHLKKLQGIRKIPEEQFMEKQFYLCRELMWLVADYLARHHKLDHESIVSDVWEKAVAKRNWKANSQTGVAE